jgi:hypothetical protein
MNESVGAGIRPDPWQFMAGRFGFAAAVAGAFAAMNNPCAAIFFSAHSFANG